MEKLIRIRDELRIKIFSVLRNSIQQLDEIKKWNSERLLMNENFISSFKVPIYEKKEILEPKMIDEVCQKYQKWRDNMKQLEKAKSNTESAFHQLVLCLQKEKKLLEEVKGSKNEYEEMIRAGNLSYWRWKEEQKRIKEEQQRISLFCYEYDHILKENEEAQSKKDKKMKFKQHYNKYFKEFNLFIKII